MTDILKTFASIKKVRTQHGLGSDEVLSCLRQLYETTSSFLSKCARQELTSKVGGKTYFSFLIGKVISRPINETLYNAGTDGIESMFHFLQDRNFEEVSPSEFTAACYNFAVGFCACIDLLKKGDQKTPGTLFEILIGHIYARRLGIEPNRNIDVLNLDMRASLPTDFIYDLGEGKAKFHLPVKTSTRERVVQVWAHQRLLDGVYGTGRFLGTLVCMTETKLDREKLEVVEICLPSQWRLYQMYIAQLTRIYYLDLPDPYRQLGNEFPRIHVRPLGEFFADVDSLIA